MEATRKCEKCGEDKPLTNEFFAYRSDTEKYRSTCRICVIKRNVENNQSLKLSNPELYEERRKKSRITQREWRRNRPKKPITKYYIYIFQNKINLKIYVGYTYNTQTRWTNHKSNANQGYEFPIYYAIRKYGWENFDKQVIEEWDTKEEAWDAEMFWIAFFRTNINRYGTEYGYNLNDGGKGSNALLGKKASKKTKLKMSKSHKGRKHTDEAKLKISVANTGRPSHRKGKILTEEHKQNLRKPNVNKRKLNHNLSEQDINDILVSKISKRKLAKLYNISRSTLKTLLKRHGV